MEKEVKTIGQEVTKAVETMKEAGKQENSPNSNRRKRKSQIHPRVKEKAPGRTRLPNCRKKSTARRKSWKMFGRAGTEERDFP